jgi:hypothetical protein
MEQSTFSFELTPTNPTAELGFEVWINDRCVVSLDHVSECCTITGNLPDDSIEAEHTLKLVLKNKQLIHTQVSDTGEILQDSCLIVSQLKFDNIELGQLITELTDYNHDFNGTQPLITEQFFGTLGCNGTVTLKFSTPIYLWLLENM